MSLLDPTITRIDILPLETVYPRTVGRNARLGSHGSGGQSTVAVVSTDTRYEAWGLVEGHPDDTSDVVGRTLSELIDAGTGVRNPAHRWLDIALHDLVGLVRDLPVHAVLGSAGSTSIEVYDGAIYLDDLDPEDAPGDVAVVLANVEADAHLGYSNFKLKIGRGNKWMPAAEGVARDIDITQAVRAARPDAKILVDANDGYSREGFRRYLDAVAEADLYWVEEPFLDDAGDLAALRAYLDAHSPATLIAEGETSPDVDALLPIAAAHHIDVLLMDIMSFGVTRWRSLMPSLRSMQVKASPHAWGRPLKTLYAAQLAAGLGNVSIIEGVPGHTGGVDTRSHSFRDGHLTVPDRPGFGLPLPTR